MATMKQIAELAGVSRGTVDRVLNNRGNINPETEARVRQIAESLSYVPNKLGRNLAIKQKRLSFAFILFNGAENNPFFDEVTAGINKKTTELEEYGVRVEKHYCDLRDYKHQLELLGSFIGSDISGIAITPINKPQIAAKLRELSENGIPSVTVNTDIAESGRIAYVGSNYLKSGRLAGNLMNIITDGSANIGIITGSNDVLCHVDRIEGFSGIIAEKYPMLNIISAAENHDDDIESYSAALKMFSEHPELDALYLAAAGVYGACRALKELGVSPKIICYDCVPTTKQLLKDGTITAVIDQQPEIQGAKPLDILFENATGNPVQSEFYYTDLQIKLQENMFD